MSDPVTLIRSCTARLKVIEHDVKGVALALTESRSIPLEVIEALAELTTVATVLDHQWVGLLSIVSLGGLLHGERRILAAVQLGAEAACASCTCPSCTKTREDAEATAAQMVAAAARQP